MVELDRAPVTVLAEAHGTSVKGFAHMCGRWYLI